MYHFFSRVLFVLGFVIGVLLAVIFVNYNSCNTKQAAQNCINSIDNLKSYNRWFASNNLSRRHSTLDQIRYGNGSYLLESQYLYNKVKVFCLILVQNVKNAHAANNTWTKNCNQVSFVDLHVQKMKIPIKKTRETSSWVLLCKALQEVPEFYNWVVISYDYTFVILENLRLLVAALDYDNKYYLGHAVTFWGTVYNMGQAGYVLSRGALSALKNKLKYNSSCTSDLTYHNREDFYLGRHLNSVNITPMDTRDVFGLSMFHPYNWQHVMFPGENYYKTSVYPILCCSKRSITFHAIEAHKIYMYYYLLYKLQIFESGNLGNKPAATPMTEKEVWQKFLREQGIEKEDVSPQEYYKLWEDLVHDPIIFADELKNAKYDF